VPVAGAALYGHRNLPEVQSLALFVICCFMIISMYGGGFATVPAYLRHMFGTMQVGAIHGRLLTAWSAAGILGPFLVNGIRQHEISVGIPKSGAYTVTMYVMVGLLLIGFICNLMLRPVDPQHYYPGTTTEFRAASGAVPRPATGAAQGAS
jgi:MFS family permease